MTTRTTNREAGFPNQRELSKQKTRQRLLKAAQKSLLQKGLSGLSMNQICKRAGIAQPSFYTHYQSLAELLAELRVQMTNQYLAPLHRQLLLLIEQWQTDGGDFLPRLHQYLEYNFDVLLKDIRLFKLVMADYHDQSSSAQGELGQMIDDINQSWCDFIASQAKHHGLEIGAAELALYVDSLSSMAHSLVLGCAANRYRREHALHALISLSDELILNYQLGQKLTPRRGLDHD